MKRFIYIFIIILIGCSADQKESKNDNHEKLRSVLKNKVQCDLIGDFKNTEIENLVGNWTDTLIWKTRKDDTCYYGFEELDRHISLEFRPNKTYSWKETFSVPSWNFIKYGECFFSNENNVTELLLAENGKMDSLSLHGDTLKATTFRLFWTDSLSMFLLPRSPVDDNYKNFEVIELKKSSL